MNFWNKSKKTTTPPTVKDIYSSPGHLIRRSQQISVSLFVDELGELGLTSVQYAALLAIRDRPDIAQRSLGRLIAIDRSTIGTVLRGLEDKGLITRQTPEDNQRIKVLSLTKSGNSLLTQTTEGISNVQRRFLAPLSIEEQAIFLQLIAKIVEKNNEFSRAPLS